MKRVLLVFGTRPEAIKMAPVVRALKARPDEVKVSVCVTAQHREMLDQVLEIFSITPDYDLDLMRSNQTLFDVTADALRGMQGVLAEANPDVVLVQGDTTTVLSGALAAFYEKIEVGHVEAGLRTDNKYSPFPEEVNRRMTSVLADYHFAPTAISADNLRREGVAEGRIYVTGNTVIDALLWAHDILGARSAADFVELADLELRERMILITGHRRENFGQGFQDMCRAIKILADKNRQVSFVYPVHLNPNVRGPVYDILKDTDNILLIEPLDYLAFVFMMTQADIILTDSGGVQEEAPSLGKPVLVMRDTTERPEAVYAGTVKLVGTDYDKIVAQTQELLDDERDYAQMARARNPYGDGQAGERIACILTGTKWQPFTMPEAANTEEMPNV